MVATRTDSIDFGDAPPGGGQGLAMRGQIATSLFGDVAQPVCIGRFEVLEEIGAGGMGVVYRARDPKLDRDAAIKVMHTEQVSARGRARLIREAQTLAKLNHPHVVTVYEVAEHEQQVFVAMEFVAGGNLRDWIRDDEPSRQEILARFLDAGRGLAAAHDAGIVHRDFKPANVLLGIDGRVRVADFGLARDEGSRETRDSQSGGVSASQSDGLTKTGMVIGTPAYMAPEQWARKSITAATDQFAYCMSLWEALAGVLPYEHGVVRAAAKSGELGAPRGADAIAGRVRKALLRGLRVDAGERWPNLGALVEALEPGRAAPWKGFAVVAVVAGVVGAAAAGSTSPIQEANSRCDELRTRMDRLWSESERDRLRELHERSAPFAAASWSGIESAIDAHTSAWLESAETVCDSGRPLDGPALECLSRSVNELRVLSERIGESDPRLVANLPAAATALRNPERCRLPNIDLVVPHPHAGSSLAKEVGPVRAAVDEARILLNLGSVSAAERVANQAIDMAAEVGFEPALAEARLIGADLEMARGNSVEASAQYLDAMATAQASRHDRVVLESIAGVLRAGAFSEAPLDELRPWIRLSEATLARLGSDRDLSTRLDEAKLDVLRLTGETDSALQLAQKLSSARGQPLERRRWARRQLAHLLADSGETLAADQIYSDLLDDALKRLGSAHPEVASLHSSLGLLHQGRPELAASHFQEAVRSSRASLGDQDVAYARSALGLAISLFSLGRNQEAKVLALEVAELQRRLLSKRDGEQGGGLVLLAKIATAQNDLTESISYWKQLVEVLDVDARRDTRLMAMNNIGYRYRLLGEWEKAEPFHRQVREHAEVGSTLYQYASLALAAIQLRRGKSEDARALVVDLEEPALSDENTEFDLELWGVRALLDGATEAEWDQWGKLCVRNGRPCFAEELRGAYP